MAEIYYDDSADFSLVRAAKVAIVGYGSQGRAHTLNLRDSGVSVRVGLPETSRSRQRVKDDGVTVDTVAKVAAWADAIMILAPDTDQARIYEESIKASLKPGKTLMFAHGFNIRYGCIKPPKDVDVSMVAPKAPGHRVREVYEEGGGTPVLIAVEQDASGKAFQFALSYAKALGGTRAGALTTTFTEETETDLFGEHATLQLREDSPTLVVAPTLRLHRTIARLSSLSRAATRGRVPAGPSLSERPLQSCSRQSLGWVSGGFAVRPKCPAPSFFYLFSWSSPSVRPGAGSTPPIANACSWPP